MAHLIHRYGTFWSFRWPGGVIPYTINSADFPAGSTERNEILQAIQTINQDTGIRLVPRANEYEYIEFAAHSSRCQTRVGMHKGRSVVSCAVQLPGFGSPQVIHEIFHSIGFYHEQQRPERDSFVTVAPSARNSVNFRIMGGVSLGTYDCQSIMHYPASSVMTPASGGCSTMGSSVMSPRDIQAIRHLLDPFDQRIVKYHWVTITSGHELIYLGGDRLLDWEPKTGKYRFFRYDRGVRNGSPIGNKAEVEGRWFTIRNGHKLIYLGGDRLLDWEPMTGKYRFFRYDRSVRNGSPIGNRPEVEGKWWTIKTGHELIYLDGDRLLDWEPMTGKYRIFRYDRGVRKGSPIGNRPEVEGTWQTIRQGQVLIYLGGDRLMAWEPATRRYRIFCYDRGAPQGFHPLRLPALVDSDRVNLKFTTSQFIYLDGDRVLEWEPATGRFEVSHFDRRILLPNHLTRRVPASVTHL